MLTETKNKTQNVHLFIYANGYVALRVRLAQGQTTMAKPLFDDIIFELRERWRVHPDDKIKGRGTWVYPPSARYQCPTDEALVADVKAAYSRRGWNANVTVFHNDYPFVDAASLG